MMTFDIATASLDEKKNSPTAIVTIMPPPLIPAAFHIAVVISRRAEPRTSVHSAGKTLL